MWEWLFLNTLKNNNNNKKHEAFVPVIKNV